MSKTSEWEGLLAYHVVEFVGRRSLILHKTNDLLEAREMAYQHSATTGLVTEVRNEFGKIVERVHVWREE